MFYEFNHLGSPEYLKIEKNQDFSFPPHLHQCFEIIIILNGEMQITIDNDTFILTKNEALLIFPNQIHSLESKCSEHILCIFSPSLVQAYTTNIAGKIPVNNKFYPDEYLIKALTQLQNDSSSAEKKGILYSLCGQFDKTASYKKKQTDKECLLNKIFLFVEDNFHSNCTLSELAKIIGYDYSYLSRYFKKIVGISFNTYINQYRLSHACYLMNNTNCSILRCAMDSGFTSLRSFNRSFKEQFGITPTAYRNTHQ